MKVQDIVEAAKGLAEPSEELWGKIKAKLTMEVPLTKGYVALVDLEDYARVSTLEWSANIRPNVNTVYALHNGNTGRFSMHRFILGVIDPKIKVDHKDRDGLNNCKYNLRICSTQQNNANSKASAKSGFKGVHWDMNLWKACITVNYKHVYLGRYKDILDAARAYDRAAIKAFGEFACTNKSLGLLKEEA